MVLYPTNFCKNFGKLLVKRLRRRKIKTRKAEEEALFVKFECRILVCAFSNSIMYMRASTNKYFA
jgi:hypothetical protein